MRRKQSKIIYIEFKFPGKNIADRKMMPPEYLELAQKRRMTKISGYTHPEDYGYDFREWVSPYTKGAHTFGGTAIVLQDWASADSLKGDPDKGIQELGRSISLRTNSILKALLDNVLGLSIEQTYGTNIFPLIKSGNISASIPIKHMKIMALQFVKYELEIAKPIKVLALGAKTYNVLRSIGVNCIPLPHPAARIGSISNHERIWLERLK